MGGFGNKFRKARESKKLSLDDISNVTKISARMLKAIEDENFDQLPGGVFNKGFIRAYAKQVGLNSDDAVSEYLACLSQEQVNSHGSGNSERRTGTDRRKSAASSSAASKTATQQSPVEVEEELPGLHLPRAEDIRHKPKEYLGRGSSRIPWLTIAIILVIVLAIALIWIRYSRQLRTEGLVAPSVAKTEAASPDAKGASQAASQPATPPSATAGAVPHPTDSRSAQTQPSTRSTPPAATATSSPNSNQPDAANTDTDTEAGQSAAPRAKSAPALNLVIRATENSWISVTADGQTVTQETLIAPAHTTVRANREIVVRVGNAAGVTFSWKGQEIPAQGGKSEVKTLVFDAEGLHKAAQPNPAPQN